MPSDIKWLSFEQVADLHDRSLEQFGGAVGFKDEAAVHSAINAPQDHAYYTGDENLLTLAVMLCSRIAGNHGFFDGKKRTALSAMRLFLQLNHLDFSEDLNAMSGYVDEDGWEWTLIEKALKDMVAHEISEDDFQGMIEDYVYEIDDAPNMSDEAQNAREGSIPDSANVIDVRFE